MTDMTTTLGVVDVAVAVVVMAHAANHRIRLYLLAGLRQHAVPEFHPPESTRLQLAGNVCKNTFGDAQGTVSIPESFVGIFGQEIERNTIAGSVHQHAHQKQLESASCRD